MVNSVADIELFFFRIHVLEIQLFTMTMKHITVIFNNSFDHVNFDHYDEQMRHNKHNILANMLNYVVEKIFYSAYKFSYRCARWITFSICRFRFRMTPLCTSLILLCFLRVAATTMSTSRTNEDHLQRSVMFDKKYIDRCDIFLHLH